MVGADSRLGSDLPREPSSGDGCCRETDRPKQRTKFGVEMVHVPVDEQLGIQGVEVLGAFPHPDGTELVGA